MRSDEARNQTLDLTTALVTLLTARARRWSGSAAELHELLPGHAADAVRLAKALTRAADELTAAGITIERKRQAGTGARILVLTCQVEQLATAASATVKPQPTAVTVGVVPDAVTVTPPIRAVTLPPAATTPSQPGPPLLACPICRGSTWRWHQSNRRRASRWLCSTCETRP